MAVLHWKDGAVGAYLDPANWVEGVAPGPGDTAIIADPSGPSFYPAGVDPSSLSSFGLVAPPGDAIVGQTINFTPAMASTTTPQLSKTIFDANTTINVTGPATQNILAWFDNAFQGSVNVGDGINSGRLELTLVHQPTGLPPALATNTGVIAIAGDSVFHIAPFLFRAGPFYDGVASFDNNGEILIGAGGQLVESESTLQDLGPYPWTFTNNGGIRVQGGDNRSTLAVLETNLAGNGGILLDGSTSTDPVWTQLRVTGNIGGGTFALRNASIAIGDVQGSTVNTGGGITFEDGNSFALLEPPFDAFAMPISGFRAGDTIVLAYNGASLFGSTYSYNWDQPTHQLTIFETPTASQTFELARLTLSGTYGPNDFALIDNTGLPSKPGAVSINNGGTFTTPFQLDITTFHTEQGVFSPFLALSGFGAGAAAGGWTSQDQYPRVLGDVNGDGRADTVGFGFAGTYSALGQANGTFAAPIVASGVFGAGAAAGGWASQDQNPRVLGDVNGDGRADIVGFGFAGAYTALGQADGTFTAPIVASTVFGSSPAAGGWASQDQNPRLLGDVNGDGQADIVGFGFGGTYTALGLADGSFAAPVLVLAIFGSSAAAGGWVSQDQAPRLLADVNGDGRADIVGFGFAGTYTALGQADGTFGAPILALNNFGTSAAAGGWASQEQSPRVLGDVNGDGRADIAGFGFLGAYTALGQANGTFETPVYTLDNFGSSIVAGGWNSENAYPRFAADVTGDRLADLVGFGSAGAFVAQSL